MYGAARRRDEAGIDLEAHAAQAITGGQEALRRLEADPQNADAIAAVHMWGGHLEDIRQAICDLKLTGAMMEIATQAGAEDAERRAASARPRPHGRAPRQQAGTLRVISS
ncbi:MAG TPA: hypothetical protein VHZ03_14200 [Trebonia sp.]|jgi:hypothetical protein|nr:hypothetical protein [Trebonia sp.]